MALSAEIGYRSALHLMAMPIGACKYVHHHVDDHERFSASGRPEYHACSFAFRNIALYQPFRLGPHLLPFGVGNNPPVILLLFRGDDLFKLLFSVSQSKVIGIHTDDRNQYVGESCLLRIFLSGSALVIVGYDSCARVILRDLGEVVCGETDYDLCPCGLMDARACRIALAEVCRPASFDDEPGSLRLEESPEPLLSVRIYLLPVDQ